MATQQEVEAALAKHYLNKVVCISLPGYIPVYGKVDRIVIEVLREPLVVIMMNNTRYTCSSEEFQECVKLMTNGNTHGTDN